MSSLNKVNEEEDDDDDDDEGASFFTDPEMPMDDK